MKIEDLSIAVWSKCVTCRGIGISETLSATRPRRKIYPPCTLCEGHGKNPTFIPLTELELADPKRDLWAAVRRWLEAKARPTKTTPDP